MRQHFVLMVVGGLEVHQREMMFVSPSLSPGIIRQNVSADALEEAATGGLLVEKMEEPPQQDRRASGVDLSILTF